MSSNLKSPDEKVEKIIKEGMDSSYMLGLRAGVYTASKVVYDILNDTSKPLMSRVERIKKYCKVSVDNKDKFVPKPNTRNESKDDNEPNVEQAKGDTVE